MTSYLPPLPRPWLVQRFERQRLIEAMKTRTLDEVVESRLSDFIAFEEEPDPVSRRLRRNAVRIYTSEELQQLISSTLLELVERPEPADE